MSKELEKVLKAYNQVLDFINEMPVSYKGYNTLGQSEYIWDRLNEIEEALDDYVELKQALIPPTAEEVCKALSDWYGKGVDYRQFMKVFAFIGSNMEIAKIIDGKIRFNVDDLPPHLVTMIGRFYEGNVK
jgi:hypothetical protein